jgi:hypothetical protein
MQSPNKRNNRDKAFTRSSAKATEDSKVDEVPSVPVPQASTPQEPTMREILNILIAQSEDQKKSQQDFLEKSQQDFLEIFQGISVQTREHNEQIRKEIMAQLATHHDLKPSQDASQPPSTYVTNDDPLWCGKIGGGSPIVESTRQVSDLKSAAEPLSFLRSPIHEIDVASTKSDTPTAQAVPFSLPTARARSVIPQLFSLTTPSLATNNIKNDAFAASLLEPTLMSNRLPAPLIEQLTFWNSGVPIGAGLIEDESIITFFLIPPPKPPFYATQPFPGFTYQDKAVPERAISLPPPPPPIPICPFSVYMPLPAPPIPIGADLIGQQISWTALYPPRDKILQDLWI